MFLWLSDQLPNKITMLVGACVTTRMKDNMSLSQEQLLVPRGCLGLEGELWCPVTKGFNQRLRLGGRGAWDHSPESFHSWTQC